MSESKEEEEEIDVTYLWTFIKARWRFIAIGALIVLLAYTMFVAGARYSCADGFSMGLKCVLPKGLTP